MGLPSARFVDVASQAWTSQKSIGLMPGVLSMRMERQPAGNTEEGDALVDGEAAELALRLGDSEGERREAERVAEAEAGGEAEYEPVIVAEAAVEADTVLVRLAEALAERVAESDALPLAKREREAETLPLPVPVVLRLRVAVVEALAAAEPLALVERDAVNEREALPVRDGEALAAPLAEALRVVEGEAAALGDCVAAEADGKLEPITDALSEAGTGDAAQLYAALAENGLLLVPQLAVVESTTETRPAPSSE